MDETYIKVKGAWKYLYRAVDKAGNTIDFLFRAKRDKVAARRFFEKAIGQSGPPETVTIDKSGSKEGLNKSFFSVTVQHIRNWWVSKVVFLLGTE